jgi:hypothetical protein
MSPDPVREGPSLTRVDGAWACSRDLVGDRVILEFTAYDFSMARIAGPAPTQGSI